MLPLLSLLSFTFFGLLALFILVMVIVPMKKMQAYKQEGITTYFYPVIGVLHFWRKNFEQQGDMMAGSKQIFKQAPNHRLMVGNLNKRLFFVLRDPRYVKEFLQNPQLYQKSQILDYVRLFIGNGLVTAEGETWKRHRRIISNSFHFEFLKNNITIIQNTAQEFLGKISPEEMKNYSVLSRMQEITGEVVGRIFFGENLNSYTFEGQSLTLALAEVVFELAQCGRTPLVLLFGVGIMKLPIFPRFQKILKRTGDFRNLCHKIIEDRKLKPQQGNDLLGMLLETQKSDDPDKRFSDEEIVNEFLTFFIAGMDTTGHAVGMTLYQLTQYPEYLKDLKQEREGLYNKQKKVTSEDVQKMEILHSILKETLRFYTPAPIIFARVALVDHNILDVPIKKGDLVIPELLASAFDERNFESPEKFKPERWRSQDASKVDPYAFIPFSAGPRNCIGQHLAIIESKIIISEFLNRFNFKLKQPYELKMGFKFLYAAQSEICFELTPLQS